MKNSFKWLLIGWTALIILLAVFSWNPTWRKDAQLDGEVPIENIQLDWGTLQVPFARLVTTIQNPKDSTQLLTGGDAGYFYSNDEGKHWQRLNFDGLNHMGPERSEDFQLLWNEQQQLVLLHNQQLFIANDPTQQWQQSVIKGEIQFIKKSKDGWLWGKVWEDEVFNFYKFKWYAGKLSLIALPLNETQEVQLHLEHDQYLQQLDSLWSIENCQLYYTRNGNKQLRMEGLSAPILVSLQKDEQTPSLIKAYGNTPLDFMSNLRNAYNRWYSDDLGQNWMAQVQGQQLPFSPLGKIYEHYCPKRPYYPLHFDSTTTLWEASPEESYWLNENTFIKLFEEGMEFSQIDNNCKILQQRILFWGKVHPQSRHYYKFAPVYHEQPPFIASIANDSLYFMISSHYGNYYQFKTPVNQQLGYRGIIWVLIKYNFVYWMLGMLPVFLLIRWIRKR